MADGDEVTAFELFSGVGGLHMGFRRAFPSGRVVASVDVNVEAKKVHALNFPTVPMIVKGIDKFSEREWDKCRADVLLMSPPCQPYTRQGNQRDTEDLRAAGLLAVVRRLERCAVEMLPRAVVMENVEGFETSESRQLLVGVLQSRGFAFQEFVVSPDQFSVPYRRDRYFLCAWRAGADGASDAFVPTGTILRTIPGCERCHPPADERSPDPGAGEEEAPAMGTEEDAARWNAAHAHCPTLRDFLGLDTPMGDVDAVRLTERHLKSGYRSLDVVGPSWRFSRCITKNYSRYHRGTGSILCEDDAAISEAQVWRGRTREGMAGLPLRFFTPQEIARLHGFDEGFQFGDVSLKNCFALLGNSLSVTVVHALCDFVRDRMGM